MKSIMPSLKPPSCFMVMMNCLLHICQRKRLKAYLMLMKILTLQGLAVETVELKGGLLERFTHEMEPFLRKQGIN
ncbi:unnamed protein product [Brassica rapa subsp. trilocularis]